jgi:LPXTG-motif cell wall-anchored protein
MKKLLLLLATTLLAVGMSVAQTNTTDANNQTNNTGTAATQNSNQNTGTAATQPATTPSGTAAQNNAGTAKTANGKRLPQTGSELPLLATLGFGSLGTGIIARFRNRIRK